MQRPAIRAGSGRPALWPRGGSQSILGVFMSLAAHADPAKLDVTYSFDGFELTCLAAPPCLYVSGPWADDW